MKFADGKRSSANVPHLNVWGFDKYAAEFPQQKKTSVFGVNRPLLHLDMFSPEHINEWPCHKYLVRWSCDLLRRCAKVTLSN